MNRLFLLLIGFFLTFIGISQDTSFVTVHVIYGSKPAAEGEDKWFGGRWGGHVGLEVAPDKVIHFNPGGKVRAFGRKDQPGTYVQSTVNSFYCTFGCDSAREMSVRIPVPESLRQRIDSTGSAFIGHEPYPYAFFGMRCAAACYHLLSVGDVYKDWRKGKMIRKVFYPRRLRKRLLKSAKKYGWEVKITEGTPRRKWDWD
jgi:hypothetical protein